MDGLIDLVLVLIVMRRPSSQMIAQIGDVVNDRMGLVGQVFVAKAAAEVLEHNLDLFRLDNGCLQLVGIVFFDRADGGVDAANPLENCVVHGFLVFWHGVYSYVHL